MGFLFHWNSFGFIRLSPSLVRLPLARLLSLLSGFPQVLLPTFRFFCCLRLLVASVLSLLQRCYLLHAVTSSFRSSSSSFCVFLFLCGTGIHARVSQQFSLSSPSPTAIHLFPLSRSPIGSLSSLASPSTPLGCSVDFARFPSPLCWLFFS